MTALTILAGFTGFSADLEVNVGDAALDPEFLGRHAFHARAGEVVGIAGVQGGQGIGGAHLLAACRLTRQVRPGDPLLRFFGQAQKVETVGVFQRFMGQIGLRLGEPGIKVGNRRTAALHEAGFNLHDQHVA